jgi:hypothetical protein
MGTSSHLSVADANATRETPTEHEIRHQERQLCAAELLMLKEHWGLKFAVEHDGFVDPGDVLDWAAELVARREVTHHG